ncbi:hypothetical protein EHS25_006435 [Saitozyma podzolica]|uniref:D-isomer specific 2-hydroxyacid dehydrogenase NAD-binding domain-containing protein n=1 Tax=Saitozyma podzolica TaxID=1890683 RepID=A0A427YRU2_9TREE|nr:hypothetical protein EHS25_006435 [Saitozyma podzolica]
MTIKTTRRPRVLFINEYSGDTEADQAIRDIADVYWFHGLDYEAAVPVVREMVEQYGPFDAFAGLFYIGDKFPMKWDEKLLGALAPHCKLYAGPGAGYDKVDVDWITSTGAYYANSPREVGRRTADGALMLLLAAMRGLTPQDQSVRSGGWRDSGVRTLDWRASTVGIIGLGNIGHMLADMCAALGMNIIYTSRHRKDVPYEHVGLDELYARADCVVLTCPLTEETKGMINREAISKMKDGVVLVNVARGEVVKEDDLVEALESRKVMRAALDVFENEPSVHSKLRSNPHVTLSPHSAAAPDSMSKGMNREVIRNVIRFLETGVPNTPVNALQLKEAAHGGSATKTKVKVVNGNA